MEYVTTPDHFPDTLPVNLLELPRALGDTATRGELRRLYLDWATFHHEALSGQFQLPNGRNIDNLGYGVIEIGPAAKAAAADYLRVQHQNSLRTPMVTILQSSRSALDEGNKHSQQEMAVLQGGDTLYQISNFEIMFGKVLPDSSIVIGQRIGGSSFFDVLELDKMLCEITSVEATRKKRRFAERFRFLSRLFKRLDSTQ